MCLFEAAVMLLSFFHLVVAAALIFAGEKRAFVIEENVS